MTVGTTAGGPTVPGMPTIGCSIVLTSSITELTAKNPSTKPGMTARSSPP